MEGTLAAIAKLYTHAETLQTRNRDALDFRSIHIGNLKDALTAAYLAGYAAAARASNGSREDSLPTEVHTMSGKTWLHAGPIERGDGPRAETIVTLPIPEVALLQNHWSEPDACMKFIPQAILQRRIG